MAAPIQGRSALARITGTEPAATIYLALLEFVGTLGPHEIAPKQTSVHLTNGAAFLGIAPRRDGLVLTVVSDDPLVSVRVQKSERASKNRCHNYIGLTTTDEIDDELKGWITRSYQRTSR